MWPFSNEALFSRNVFANSDCSEANLKLPVLSLRIIKLTDALQRLQIPSKKIIGLLLAFVFMKKGFAL
jgi:hypothetical protein